MRFTIARALAVAGVLTCAYARPASAQSRALVEPSVAFGAAYDDHLFIGEASESDLILRMTPGLRASVLGQRGSLLLNYSFDAERFKRLTALNDSFVRQSFGLEGEMRSSQATTFSFNSHYDSSLTPTDFNVRTGLRTTVPSDRTPGWHGNVGMELEHALSARRVMAVRYGYTDEGIRAFDARIGTNAFDLQFTFGHGTRNERRLDYFGRAYTFDDVEGRRSVVSQGVIVGWTRRLSATTSLGLEVGPRLTGSQLRPEISVVVQRRMKGNWIAVYYERSQATALGASGLFDVEDVRVESVFRRLGVYEVRVDMGVYANSLRDTSAHVYLASFDVTRSLNRVLSLAASYAVSRQQGAFGLESESYQRNVASIRLVFSPFQDPAARLQHALAADAVATQRRVR